VFGLNEAGRQRGALGGNLTILRCWDCSCELRGVKRSTDRGAGVNRRSEQTRPCFVLCCFPSMRGATQIWHSTAHPMRHLLSHSPYSLLRARFESLWGHYVQTGLCARTNCASLLPHSGRRHGVHSLSDLLFSGGKRNQRSFVWASRTCGGSLSVKSVFLCCVGANG
jgi:hypothetical protein